MQLRELFGIKQATSEINTEDDWQTLLQTHGFRPIGRGFGGQVYENPKIPYVLKIFTAEDPGYPQWVNICKTQLKGNPYVPQYRGGIVRVSSGVLAVRMEKLQPATADQKVLVKHIQQALLTSLRTKADWQPLLEKFDLDSDLIAVIEQIYHAASSPPIRLDLKSANVMSRNGQLVFTDPLA